jgi:geranylgeranyl pyrophosphate synthase
VFGEAVAILAGDALLARAFELLSRDAPSPELLGRRALAARTLAAAVGSQGMLGGQVEDLASEGRDVSQAALERIHRCKTGALLEASVRGGAILGGAPPQALDALGRYAAALGLAFQIVDDILDATSTAEQLGKTAGKDKRSQKATYVRVHGLAAARARARALHDESVAWLEPLGDRGALLKALARLAVERQA